MSVETPVRIYDLARELKLNTTRVIEDLRREGADVNVPSQSVSKELAEKVRNKHFPKIEIALMRPIKVIKATENEVEECFVEKCRSMRYGQLRNYINECLNKISKEQNSNHHIPKNEVTYNELIKLLEKKLSDEAVGFESRLTRKKKCEEANACVEWIFAKKRQCFYKSGVKTLGNFSKLTKFSEVKNSSNKNSDYNSIQEINFQELSWKILPQEEWNSSTLTKYFKDLIKKSQWQGKLYDESRRRKIESNLEISLAYLGKEKFEGYIVYCFGWTDKVILECPFYGNATYIIKGDWKEITKVPKWVARFKYSNQVTVIRHSNLWFEKLKNALRNPN